MNRPMFLVTNDDGIESPGIQLLEAAASLFGDVLTVAPKSEMSAVGQSITLHAPLRMQKYSDSRFAVVTGTPTDCIYLATNHLVAKQPSMVLSGINHGANLGYDVVYSGTVAGARQAALQKIPAIAFSYAGGVTPPTDDILPYVIEIIRQTLTQRFPREVFLNVNIPSTKIGPVAGYKVTRLGHRIFSTTVESRIDPRGSEYVWIAGRRSGDDDFPDSDSTAIQQGFVSVTPIQLDTTAHSLIPTLTDWKIFSEPAESKTDQ
ncbi:MAG: 5'/3'-nucleotidase SurE [Myxococcales bacterium]|nr:5'/3'-nucleotidase SurE [Myxococcales bacterium]